jgi:hypothetical protein
VGKAIRRRIARRRRKTRQAALEAERILKGLAEFEMRCERPGCGHAKAEHILMADGTRGWCEADSKTNKVLTCGCTDYFLGPPT